MLVANHGPFTWGVDSARYAAPHSDRDLDVRRRRRGERGGSEDAVQDEHGEVTVLGGHGFLSGPAGANGGMVQDAAAAA